MGRGLRCVRYYRRLFRLFYPCIGWEREVRRAGCGWVGDGWDVGLQAESEGGMDGRENGDGRMGENGWNGYERPSTVLEQRVI